MFSFPSKGVTPSAAAGRAGADAIELLGGAAVLSISPSDSEGGTPGVAVAPDEPEARRRAEAFARIRETMETSEPLDAPQAAGRGIPLREFIADATSLDVVRSVVASGVLSKEPFKVPAGVAVPSSSAESVVSSQPECLGDAWIDAASAKDEARCFEILDHAVGRIIAQDIAARWWHDARRRERPRKLGVEDVSDAYRKMADALVERELVCDSYLFETGRPIVLTVLSRADGTESTFGLAAGLAQDAAAEESLSEALQGRVALLWPHYPPMDPLAFARLVTGWGAGSRKVQQLRELSRVTREAPPQAPAQGSWSELAELRFDHEPLVVRWPSSDGAFAGRVLCPEQMSTNVPIRSG